MSDVFGGWTMAVKFGWLFLTTVFQSRARFGLLHAIAVVMVFAGVGTAHAEPTIACPPGTRYTVPIPD